MRILIIKPSSLGDVVHALPTVNLIRKRFPDAHISWLINDTLASLLKCCPVIDELIEFPRRQFGKLTRFPRFLAFLRGLRRQGFDLVVDLQGLFRSGLMTWATRAPRRIGLSDAREGARFFHNEVVNVSLAHAVDRYLLAARHLGCKPVPIEFPLGDLPENAQYIDSLLEGRAPSRPLSPAARTEPRPPNRFLIAVNPSARWDTKLWGDDKFAALLRQLPSNRLVITGSAADAPRIGAMIAASCSNAPLSTLHSPTSPLNLAGKTDLAQLAELYRRCALLITNDSGPMHIAAAVGTPVVAIFGPTDPALTGPYGRNHVVLRASIPCSPCMKDHCTHTPPMECMSLVTVEQVLEAVERFLA